MEKEQWQKMIGDVAGQAIVFDEQSLASVLLSEPNLLVNFEYLDHELVIYTEVGQLVNEQQLAQLLEANCLWNKTNGSTLSLFQREHILLAKAIGHQEYIRFSDLYSDFINAASYWQETLMEPMASSEKPTEPHPFAHHPGSLFV